MSVDKVELSSHFFDFQIFLVFFPQVWWVDWKELHISTWTVIISLVVDQMFIMVILHCTIQQLFYQLQVHIPMVILLYIITTTDKKNTEFLLCNKFLFLSMNIPQLIFVQNNSFFIEVFRCTLFQEKNPIGFDYKSSNTRAVCVNEQTVERRGVSSKAVFSRNE